MQDLMPPIDTSDKVFHDGNPAIGELGTIVPAKWLNNVQGAVRNLQSELLTVLGSAEMASDPLKQDQLKQAIAKIYAPLESPALTGTPTAPTAARFDATQKIANTDWIKRRGQEFSELIGLDKSTVLTADHAGKVIYVNSLAPVTITLPPANAVPSGATITIFSTGPTVSLNRPASGAGNTDQINLGGVLVTGVGVGQGEDITLVSDGRSPGVWYPSSRTAALAQAAGFEASLAGNGYQKLPSGLIFQWGTIVSGANGIATVTYPMVFPTATLRVIPTILNSIGGLGAVASVSFAPPPATSGCTLYTCYNSVACVATIAYLAIGM